MTKGRLWKVVSELFTPLFINNSYPSITPIMNDKTFVLFGVLIIALISIATLVYSENVLTEVRQEVSEAYEFYMDNYCACIGEVENEDYISFFENKKKTEGD